jgi:succinate dehydrogenase / fumarate reductase membrane anchor subunit
MNGSTLFYLVRLSALFVLGYSLWILSFILTNKPIDYVAWVSFTNQSLFQFSTTFAFLFMLIHAFIGLWTVGTDYFTSRTLGFISPTLIRYADFIRGAYTIIFVALGLLIVTTTLFVIWS